MLTLEIFLKKDKCPFDLFTLINQYSFICCPSVLVLYVLGLN